MKIGAATASVMLVALSVSGSSATARSVSVPDPREGVIDARLVVIVQREEGDRYRIVRSFLGPFKPGDEVNVPGFHLYRQQMYGPDLVEPITDATRILMFLGPMEGTADLWEVMHHGNCFFWGETVADFDRLVSMATRAVKLRADWEHARDLADPKKRVEALWPFLQVKGVSFPQHTRDELMKTGAVAGDYLADRWTVLPDLERHSFSELGRFGSSKLHGVLRDHLVQVRSEFEAYLKDHNLKRIAVSHDWNQGLPISIKDLYGDLYHGMANLKSFKDRRDLPFFREFADWASANDFEQVCGEAIYALGGMPARENLAAIAVVRTRWTPKAAGEYDGYLDAMVYALRKNTFPEAIPLLVTFLDDPTRGTMAREALTEIVRDDLGPDAKPWLEWYRAARRDP